MKRLKEIIVEILERFQESNLTSDEARKRIADEIIALHAKEIVNAMKGIPKSIKKK